MIDDPEEFAWQELERKQQKKPKTVTERQALQIAYNALVEIDRQTPYPIAKHAIKVINSVLNVSATDWQAIAADQAMTIAMSRIDEDDIIGVARKSLRQAIEQAENPVEPPDYVEPVTTDYHEGWEEGFKAGNALTPPKRPVKSYTGGVPQYATDAPKREWVGLTDEEISNCWINSVASGTFTKRNVYEAIEAKLKERNT